MALPTYASPLEKAWHYCYLAICAAIFFFLIAPIVSGLLGVLVWGERPTAPRLLGSALSIKPILELRDGALEPVDVRVPQTLVHVRITGARATTGCHLLVRVTALRHAGDGVGGRLIDSCDVHPESREVFPAGVHGVRHERRSVVHIT